MPMITKQNWNSSEYVNMGIPSFPEGKEAPSKMEGQTAYRYWQR